MPRESGTRPLAAIGMGSRLLYLIFSLTQNTGIYPSWLDVFHVTAKYTYLPLHIWGLLIFALQICWRRIRNNQNFTRATETLVSVRVNTRQQPSWAQRYNATCAAACGSSGAVQWPARKASHHQLSNSHAASASGSPSVSSIWVNKNLFQLTTGFSQIWM